MVQDHNQEKVNLEKEFGILQVNSFIYDDENTLWIASSQGLFEVVNSKIKVHYNIKNQDSLDFPTDTIWDITFQKPDMLWLGTEKGLVSLDIKKKVLQKIVHPVNKYISSRLTSFLFEDSKGFIWIGTTDNGLNCLNPQTGEVSCFIEIPGDSISFLGI